MGLTNAWKLRVFEEVMKVVFAIAVIVACVAANGSMPTVAEREVDIIPEEEELIQAKADEMSLVQAQSGFQSEVAHMANGRPGILGGRINVGRQRTVIIRPRDSAGSPNAEPTEDIVTSFKSQRRIAEGGDAEPTVDREDDFASEISKTNPSQSVLNPKFSASEARAGHGVTDEVAKIRSDDATSSVQNLYSIRL